MSPILFPESYECAHTWGAIRLSREQREKHTLKAAYQIHTRNLILSIIYVSLRAKGSKVIRQSIDSYAIRTGY